MRNELRIVALLMLMVLPIGAIGQGVDDIRFKVNVNDLPSIAATVTYTTGTANWTQTWSSVSNQFDFTGGFAQASWGSTATNGQVSGRFLTTDGTAGGTQAPLNVGQKVTIRISGVDVESRTGIQTDGRIGISLRSASGIYDDGGTGSAFNRLAYNARIRIDFLGGGTSARLIGSATTTSGMPGFSDFKAGRTYEIEIISSSEFNMQVSDGGTRYNVVAMNGTGTINQIMAYNIGQNMNARFTNLAVDDMEFISIRSNASETKTISGVISDNGAAANEVRKVGTGLAILNGNHTYTGATVVEAGTLRINGTFASSGFTVKSGAILEINSASVIENLVVEDGGAVNIIGSGALTVNGGINVQEGGSMALSSTIGGDFKTSGNVTLNGTFTHNNRAVFFVGAGDQFLTKSTGDGVLTLPYVIVDKGNNSDRIFMGGTHLHITRKVTLTKGRLDPNSGSITFVSDATHSASVDPFGTGDINGNFHVQRHLARSTDPVGSQWFLGSPIPAPFTGSSAGLLSNVWTQGAMGANATGGNPTVFRYNESSGMGGWSAITDLTVPTDRGKGYLVGIYKDDVNGGAVDGGWPKTLSVTGAWQSSENDGSAVSLPVAFTDDAGTSIDERGWNLVSNPFISVIDWKAANGWTRTNIENWYYTVTESGSVGVFNHTTDVGTEGLTRFIAPFQGFWVKANALNPVLSLADSVKVPDNQVTLNKSAETPTLWMEWVYSTGRRVNTAITFREDGALGRDANDAPLMVMGGTNRMSVGTKDIESSAPLALQHLPMVGGRLEIPIVAKSASIGGYTIALSDQRAIPSDWQLILRCERTGNLYDVRAGERITLGMGADEVAFFTLIIDPTSSTSVDRGPETVGRMELEQNYPNPFNPSTQIRFTLQSSHVTRLTVYDILGREITVLVNGPMSAGSHSVSFDASNLTSGVYVYKLEAGGEILTKRMTLLK